jgi:hypothetical protein
MDEKGSKHNYLFTLIKFFLFLIIFCLIVGLSKEFLKALKATQGLSLSIISLSALSPFLFYTFVADLNNVYKGIQNFFFRSTIFTFVVPSLFVLLGLAYFILPKVFNFDFDRDVFLFLGGFILTCHLTFIARETKGNTFTAFINYLFNFSILYIFNLILFGLYLRAGFKIHIGQITLDGIKTGAILIKSLFTQITG